MLCTDSKEGVFGQQCCAFEDLVFKAGGKSAGQALAGSTISIPGFSGRDFAKIPGSRDFRDRD